ncbi:response regulator [Anabaena lutea]|uniref:response regulator n=1 Tax=Anabaena lutea TaxID=212350 RepID=UPI001F558964
MAIRELKREFADIQIEEIKNPQDLAQALEKGIFDIVVTDYQILWTDGLTILRTFKQRYPNRPVVMFTSSGSQEVAVEAMKSGLDDYVLKSPKHSSRLATAVKLAVERTEARHKAAHLEIRLNSLLNQLEVGVFRATLDGQLLEANHAFLHLIGVSTLSQAQNFHLSEIFCCSQDMVHYQGERSPFAERLSTTRYANAEKVGVPPSPEADLQALQPNQLRTAEGKLHRPDGTILWVKWSETLTNVDGEVVIDGLVENITNRKRSEEALQLLAQAGAVLNSSLDYEKTLANVADLTVPSLADWCVLDVLEEDDSMRRFAVVHQDPAKVELARELQRRYPINPNTPHGVTNVLRTKQSEIYPIITDEQLVVSASDAEHLHILRELGLKSAMIVPLLARGRILGVLTLIASESGRTYNSFDLSIAEELATRAALAIDNGRLYLVAQRDRTTAETASRLKDEFLATLSHELRTPLNAILGWSQMLLNKISNSSTSRRALETIVRNAKAQTQIVEDILDVSQIIRGKLPLQVVPVDLVPIIKTVIISLHPAITAKAIHLEVHLNLVEGKVLGDAARLQQIFWNLLSNAVKFTPQSGDILVQLAQVDTEAHIIVQDTGIGISAEFLPFVFDRFRQADGSTTRFYGGLGLGLAIVRHLAELHGGTVEAASLGEGQGATFTVKLPLMPKQSSDRNYLAEGNTTMSHGSQIHHQTQNHELCLTDLRILVVDDEADLRELLTFILEQEGAQVVVAASAQEAMVAVCNSQFNLFVFDIGMPEENGYMLLSRVRSLEGHNRHTPAIALTAYASEEYRQQALAVGFQQYIAKPVEPDEFVAAVAHLAGRLKQNL